MKVLMINGSPHEKGCTYTALKAVADVLVQEGIESEIFHIGTKPVMGCLNCKACIKTGYCVYNSDRLNDCVDKLKNADALIVGSPVYYAGPNGALCAFLDRLFFCKSKYYAGKPAAAVVNCRRGGASAAFERLNKYFTISNMPVIPSQYWNSTHGFTPEEVLRDEEGMQTMRTLGKNAAWMIKALASMPQPEREKQIYTNFIPRERK